MNKKYRKLIVNNSCLVVALLFIVSGCATQSKKNQILAVQQKRIVKLEKQLKYKQKQIDHLKVKKWVQEPTMNSSKNDFAQLKKMMIDRNWVNALKLSAQMKKQNPKSIKLARYRSLIFNKMGLLSQEKSEKRIIQNLKANRLPDQKSKIR